MVWKSSCHSKETDNGKLNLKLKLRKNAIQELVSKAALINVLDCYAGENVIWNNIHCDNYTGIELKKNKGNNNIHGNNLDIIPTLDLTQYNVIDLDAYGIPFPQMQLILPRIKKGTIVFYTCGTNKISNLTKECIEYYNLGEIYEKNRTLLNGHALELFYGMLYDYGVKEIHEYQIVGKFNMRYGYFIY